MISWQFTRFPPALLDRLAAWQHGFDASFHWEDGWTSETIRDEWLAEGHTLESLVRTELEGRAEVVLRLPGFDTEG